MNFLLSRLIVVPLLLCCVACDDSGAGSELLNDDAPTGQGVNRGMTGTMILVHDSEPWELDLHTGKISDIKTEPPNWGWYYENDYAYHNVASFGLSPTLQGEGGYLLGVRNCWGNGTLGCIVSFDKTFEREKKNNTSFNIEKHPVESLDGKYVAMQDRDTGEIAIFDAITDELFRDVDFGFSAGAVDMTWGPDGKVHFTKWWNNSNRIYRLHPRTSVLDGTTDLDVPAGTLERIRFSRDGTKMLIHHHSSSSGNAIYVQDMVTKTMTRVVRQGSSVKSHFGNPEWSPDGKWITFLVGGSTFFISRRPYLYAVPSDAVDAVVEGSELADQPEPAFRVRNNSRELFSPTASHANKLYIIGEAFWKP